MLTFCVGELPRRNVGFDQRINDINLCWIKKAVDIARQINRPLQWNHGVDCLPFGEQRLTESMQRSNQQTVCARALSVDQLDGASVALDSDIEVATSVCHGTEIGQRVYKFARAGLSARLDQAEQRCRAILCARPVTCFESAFEAEEKLALFRCRGGYYRMTESQQTAEHNDDARPESLCKPSGQGFSKR